LIDGSVEPDGSRFWRRSFGALSRWKMKIMRDVSPSLRAKLDSAVSTFCSCWRIARKDGTVLGFTDHDRDLGFGGVLYRAASGLTASEAETSLGFAIGGSEVSGAIRSDGVTEAELANGIYDGAGVEIWLVDWSNVEDRLLLDAASIGEVRRSEFAFVAELRSLAHLLDQPRGLSFQRCCSADLGDARCGVDLESASFRSSGAVVGFADGGLVVGLAVDFVDDFFTGGRALFAGGASVTIKWHKAAEDSAMLSLWTQPGGAIAIGDSVELVAGCDKSAGTCRTKFANIVNFRGFPHMPGNDLVIAYPSALAPTMDGGSLFR
jgi:uncharacterized phage protein (TIGR02218 family)